MKLLVTCPLGLWSLLSQEIKKLWYFPINTFQTWTFVETDYKGMLKINYLSRIANKVYIQIAEGSAKTFDELFEIVKISDYAQFSSNNNLSLKVECNKSSILNSTRAIQSVAHKAILESITRFWKEEKYVEDLLLVNNHDYINLYLNSSWTALYQRGYKIKWWEAPLKENIAVALLLLAWWKFKAPLYDFFCWSWTIVTEAALLAKNIAPWTRRHFAFEHFKNFDHWWFLAIKEDAQAKQFNWDYKIYASDISKEAIEISQENSKRAWVDDIIQFEQKDFLNTTLSQDERSWIISNPPYWKRITSPNLEQLYTKLKNSFTRNIFWGWISSIEGTSIKKDFFSSKKLYNWAEECHFYRRKPN